MYSMKINLYSKCGWKCFNFWRNVASKKIKSNYIMRQPKYILQYISMSDCLPWSVLCASACVPGWFLEGASGGVLYLLSPNMCYCVHSLQLIAATKPRDFRLFLKGEWIIAYSLQVEKWRCRMLKVWRRATGGRWRRETEAGLLRQGLVFEVFH